MKTNNAHSWKAISPPPDITDTDFWIGTSGYNFDDWVGRFNPPDEKRKSNGQVDLERLEFYQNYFSFVELNHTFDQVPSLATFQELERSSKASMRFAVRVHRDISHSKAPDLDRGVDLIRSLIAAVGPLVETGKFYSFLIQLGEQVCRSQERLDHLLSVASEAVKRRLDVHIEFRHTSWHHVYPLQILRDYGIGICNCEIPPVKHAFPLKAYATTEKGYIRYSGRNREAWQRGVRSDNPGERLEEKLERTDYLYTGAEIEARMKGQIELSRKVSETALVYANCRRAKGVANAIQNIQQLKQHFDFAAILGDA